MEPVYFKRYRMEICLEGLNLTPTPTPKCYSFLAWDESLLDAFAWAKYLSFRGEIDGKVFPCLAELDGCRRLMNEIVSKPGFLPQATWLVVCATNEPGIQQYCGCVQGINVGNGQGAIQNLGVVPNHRRQGLGTALMQRALEGFRQAALTRAYLEVTAQNLDAIRLYSRLGFHIVKTLYRAVETAAQK